MYFVKGVRAHQGVNEITFDEDFVLVFANARFTVGNYYLDCCDKKVWKTSFCIVVNDI